MQIDLTKLSEVDILTLTIYGEARGEPIEGQVAVGNVIANRKKNNKASTYAEICLAPDQFSCWNENDPNYDILMKYAGVFENDQNVSPTDKLLDQCMWVATGIISGVVNDNTDGALNYITVNLWKSHCPDWARDFNLTIGNQIYGTAT